MSKYRRRGLLTHLFLGIVIFFFIVLILQSRWLPEHENNKQENNEILESDNGGREHSHHDDGHQTKPPDKPMMPHNNEQPKKQQKKNEKQNKKDQKKEKKKEDPPTGAPIYIPPIPKITDPADPHYDKDKIMNMLREMQVDPFSLDNATWALVPTWSEVSKIWGDKPVVHGLDQHCKTFREAVPAKQRKVAVAGMFSTGTNLLAQLLQHNCGIPERIEWLGRAKGHGMEWQVPWGKHNGFRYRGKHSVREFLSDKHGAVLDDYLPVATARNPHDWMSSICRHSYTIRWPHTKQNCPNLFGSHDRPNNVSVAVGADDHRVPFDSLLHMWNVWNGEYFYSKKESPAIVVRFEDLVFFPRELTEQVCHCAGGEVIKPHHVYSDRDVSGGGNFHYVVGSSLTGPGHGSKNPLNGLLESWIKYAKPMEEREKKFRKEDLDFIDQYLDKSMAEVMGYTKR